MRRRSLQGLKRRCDSLVRIIFVYPPLFGAIPREELYRQFYVHRDKMGDPTSMRSPDEVFCTGHSGMVRLCLMLCAFTVVGNLFRIYGGKDYRVETMMLGSLLGYEHLSSGWSPGGGR